MKAEAVSFREGMFRALPGLRKVSNEVIAEQTEKGRIIPFPKVAVPAGERGSRFWNYKNANNELFFEAGFRVKKGLDNKWYIVNQGVECPHCGDIWHFSNETYRDLSNKVCWPCQQDKVRETIKEL